MRLAFQRIVHAGCARQFVSRLGIEVCRVAVGDDGAGVGDNDRTRLRRADDRSADAALGSTTKAPIAWANSPVLRQIL